jgi:hypothetical protein
VFGNQVVGVRDSLCQWNVFVSTNFQRMIESSGHFNSRSNPWASLNEILLGQNRKVFADISQEP